MLDKTARKVLRYMIKVQTPQDKYTIACNANLSDNPEELVDLSERALDYLLEVGCVKSYISDLNTISYKLTNHGTMYFKKKAFDFLYPIITATISLILSLILK